MVCEDNRALLAGKSPYLSAAMDSADSVTAISTKPPFRPSQAAGLSVITVEKATGQPLQYGLFAWVRGGPAGIATDALAADSSGFL